MRRAPWTIPSPLSVLVVLSLLGLLPGAAPLLAAPPARRPTPPAARGRIAGSFQASPAPAYDALFRRTEGWTGADGAYALPLARQRILWTFGDTWVGTIRDGKRRDASMPNNTVAVQEGLDPAAAKVRFYWGRKPDGKPGSFLAPDDGRGWFWPLHGLRAGPRLYLFWVRIDRTPDPSAFGFKTTGSVLSVTENPDAPPDRWVTRQVRVPWRRIRAKGDLVYGGAVLPVGAWAYVYGTDEETVGGVLTRHLTVARVEASRIEDFHAWRFYRRGSWRRGYVRAQRLFSRVGRELTVIPLPSLGRYAAVFSDNGLSRDVVARLAEAPEGPWSDPVVLYRCPEMGARGGTIFTYAGKAHGCLSTRPDEFFVTYADNTSDFAALIADASLYWPRFVRLRVRP